MSGRVVNCRHEAYDVYIGRGPDPLTGRPSEWRNPYSHLPSRSPGVIVVDSREEANRRYEIFLRAQIYYDGLPLEKLAALHGKRLGCWCAPEPCHGEVLLERAAWALRKLHGNPTLKSSETCR